MTFLAFHNFYVLEPNLENESFLDNLDPVGFGFGSQKSYLRCPLGLLYTERERFVDVCKVLVQSPSMHGRGFIFIYLGYVCFKNVIENYYSYLISQLKIY